jgi:hypothetical protein
MKRSSDTTGERQYSREDFKRYVGAAGFGFGKGPEEVEGRR